MELIDKSALVAEIEKMLQNEYPCDNSEQGTGYSCALYELQDFLNTLEVKGVDLEDDVDKILKENDWNFDKIDFYQFAKHFFELGLKAQKGE